MNDLETYFEHNQGHLINKWRHYFAVYDRHLSRFRGGDVHLLEIGVRHGGSLQMWKDYLGSRARIYGVDIDPDTRGLEDEQIEIIIGDQEDREFLRQLAHRLPRIDILLDDGGHTMAQQINTFEVLFPHIAGDGIYICEDTHTSYWAAFGGGYRRRGTFIEYAKALVDQLHAYHNQDGVQGWTVTDFTRAVESMHFYDSMVVMEKTRQGEPHMVHKGRFRLPRLRPQSRQTRL